jgi:hypothetical protein
MLNLETLKKYVMNYNFSEFHSTSCQLTSRSKFRPMSANTISINDYTKKCWTVTPCGLSGGYQRFLGTNIATNFKTKVM